MTQYLLLISLFLTLGAGCSVKSSSNEHQKVQTQEIPKQTVEPTPYKRLQLTEKDSRALDRVLPKKARQILEQAEALELSSFEGHPGEKVIRNTVEIRDATTKEQLLDSLYDGIAAPVMPHACFKPRHSIRAAYKEETVELIICFECLNFRGSVSGGESLSGTINRSPEELFNRIIQSQKEGQS